MPSNWSSLQIADQPAELLAPEGARFALLWLHSQAEEAPSARLTALIEQHKIACVAPRGGQSWWITSEKYLLEQVVPWMRQKWLGLAVAGIEMGGQGALRLALKYPSIFRVAAGLGSAIDFHELYGRGTPLDAMYDSRERARQDTATLHMHPSEWPPHLWFACDPMDPWFRGNDRLHEKLRAYGVPHTADLDSSGSGYVDAMLEPMLKFILNGLERESRRLM